MTTPIQPNNPVSGITAQIANYSQANSAMNAQKAYYVNELQFLLQQMHTGHMSAGTALWLFQLECMPAVTNTCQYNMQLESDALNIANDLRGDITNAQNDYNVMIADIEKGGGGGSAAASKLLKDINTLKHALGIHGITKIMQTNSISNIKWRAGFIFILVFRNYLIARCRFQYSHFIRDIIKIDYLCDIFLLCFT